MTSRTMEARAVISAQDRTGGVFAKVAGKLREVERTAARVNAQQARLATTGAATVAGFRGLGAAAGAYVGAGSITQAAKRFGDFDERLRRFQNTAEITGEQLGALETKVRTAARAYGMTAEDVFGGPEKLVAGGMKFDDALKRTDTLARVAKAYGASTTELGDATLSMAQSLGITDKDLPTAFDRLAKSTKQGQIEFNGFAKWLPTLSARMKSLGVVGLDAVDTIGAMSQAARKVAGNDEEAMNNIVNFLDKLADEKTQKEMKKLGFDIESIYKVSQKKGTNFVDDMITALDKATKGGDLFKSMDVLGDRQARTGMIGILQNLKEMRANIAEMRQAAGTVDRDLANVMAGPKAQVQAFRTAVDEVTTSFLRLGAQAAPALEGVARLVDRVNAGMSGPRDAARQIAGGLIVQPGREAPGQAPRAFAPGSGGFRSRAGRGYVAPGSSPAADADRAMARARAAERTFVGATGSPDIDDAFGAGKQARDHFLDLKGAARREAGRRGGLSIYDARARLDAIEAQIAGVRSRAHEGERMPKGSPMRDRFDRRLQETVEGLVRERMQIGNALDGKGAPSAEEIGSAVRAALEGMKAEVTKPVDVTGRVEAEIKGKAQVHVQIGLDNAGLLRVVGMKAGSDGNVSASVGTSMPGARRGQGQYPPGGS